MPPADRRPRPAPPPTKGQGRETRPRPDGNVGEFRAADGPLGRVLGSDDGMIKGRSGYQLESDASALILLRRVAFLDEKTRELSRDGMRALLRWAASTNLGQGEGGEAGLVDQVSTRRTAALLALRRTGDKVVRLRVKPEWRLVIGSGGDDNPHEFGLALHGTYGWPVIPGTVMKGMTAAWASGSSRAGEPKAENARLDQIFGIPRPGPSFRKGEHARRGTVRFLDALPAGEPVRVTVDVLTPHQQPYYKDDPPSAPPAEHHNPIPHEFLVVCGGEFAVDLVGPAADVDQAAEWCRQAVGELGAGAKSAAGYGYLSSRKITEVEAP